MVLIFARYVSNQVKCIGIVNIQNYYKRPRIPVCDGKVCDSSCAHEYVDWMTHYKYPQLHPSVNTDSRTTVTKCLHLKAGRKLVIYTNPGELLRRIEWIFGFRVSCNRSLCKNTVRCLAPNTGPSTNALPQLWNRQSHLYRNDHCQYSSSVFFLKMSQAFKLVNIYLLELTC